MNALVVGFGSIGQRHVSNLMANKRVAHVTVASRRARALGERFFRGTKCRWALGLPKQRYDFAMICNETDRHLATALALADQKIPLFIEKPIAHRRRGVDVLRRRARANGVPVFVAYNLRFLGALRQLKEWIERKRLGRLCFARMEVGQYLPDWRPGRDWRATYSARPSRGGGVGLDLSHEIDGMRWLFGDPKTALRASSHVGNLKIRADTLWESVFPYRDGFICSVHMDCLEKTPRRRIRVVGTKGVAEVDLMGGVLSLDVEGRRRYWKSPALFDREKTYVDELNYFLDCLETGRPPTPSVDDGIRVLDLLGV